MPVAMDAEGGFDLDYSALLVADGFVLDGAALDFIRARRDAFLGPLAESCDVLIAEGLMEVVDFSEHYRDHDEDVRARVDSILGER